MDKGVKVKEKAEIECQKHKGLEAYLRGLRRYQELKGEGR